MGDLYFGMWNAKDMLKVAGDILQEANYGTYAPQDLVMEPVALTAAMVESSGNTAVPAYMNSGLSFTSPSFVIGYAPGFTEDQLATKTNINPGFGRNDIERDEGKAVYIGRVDIQANSKQGSSWSSNDLYAKDSFRTYIGRNDTIHDVAREESPLIACTGMAMSINQTNSNQTQGFTFYGWKITVMS